jgi:hypothetical protein
MTVDAELLVPFSTGWCDVVNAHLGRNWRARPKPAGGHSRRPSHDAVSATALVRLLRLGKPALEGSVTVVPSDEHAPVILSPVAEPRAEPLVTSTILIEAPLVILRRLSGRTAGDCVRDVKLYSLARMLSGMEALEDLLRRGMASGVLYELDQGVRFPVFDDFTLMR